MFIGKELFVKKLHRKKFREKNHRKYFLKNSFIEKTQEMKIRKLKI